MLILAMVTRWGGWCSVKRWHRLWSQLAASVGWRCTCSCASPTHLCDALPCQFRKEVIWLCCFWQSTAVCLSIAACTGVCRGNSTPLFISSLTLAEGLLIICWVSSMLARGKPPLAIIAIFKTRRMSDCSSCTRPPRLTIVADMLKTYNKLVAASNNDNRRLPQSYTLPYPPWMWLKPASSTHGDAH